jgi:hypothetical protein
MKSTMMSSPLLLDSMMERAGKLFPEVELVSVLPDCSRHRYTYGEYRSDPNNCRMRRSMSGSQRVTAWQP